MLLIHHHLGLGDHFVCNGIVRYIFFNERKDITLVVKNHNYQTVKALYADIPIKFMIVNSDEDVNPIGYYYLKVGFEHCDYQNWEKSFYNQLNLDYSNRYKYAFFPRNLDRENELFKKLNILNDYVFCNISCSQGDFKIDVQTQMQKIYLQKITDNLLDWIGVLENSKEIHTIDSSIFHIVKNLNLKNEKYFYNIRGTPVSLDNQDWILK